ncbi:uncharacterized protein [Hyperolius riggenbachi]|uniref:uncharacterized protein isoform X2 n=1 Tax=Hyperolius riggenbachi TaxID=752182 RepID=UPI0035A30DE6
MDLMDFSSYSDISSAFMTKTIDRIISPMAVQLCHLVIMVECEGSKYNGGSDVMEQMAEDLSKATEHLADTAIRVGVESDDGHLKQEMEQAAKNLLITGENILLSIQKLCIQPAIRKHQEDLIITAQSILTGTMKILRLEDDAGVRKILGATDWLLECLYCLQKAENIPDILSQFCEFSEAVLLVNSLTEKRILDIKDTLHQRNLSQTLQTLRKCVPMLYTATQSNIKHPHNEQMLASQLYVFDLASKTLQELKCLLINGPDKKHHCRKRGSFSQEMHELLELLSGLNPKQISCNELDFLVGAVVFYCMYVADCSRPNMKLQLVKHCQSLLEHRRKLSDYLNERQKNSGLGRVHCKLEQLCASMKAELKHLSQTLVSTIFFQILDAFTVKDPLKTLLKAVLKHSKKVNLQLQNLFASKSFPLLQAFQNHTAQLLKISSLVTAQCSEERTIADIENSVDFLCRVRDEVIELIIENKAYNESKMFEKAQTIYQKWIKATESLMMSFDNMLTVHQFLDLCIRELEENRYHCEKLLRSQDPEIFQHHAADLCNLAERVGQVINRHVDQSKDPIFRNGLRVLVRHLERTTLETRDAMMNCFEAASSLATQKSFLEKVNELLESIHKVKEGVSGYNHPDLLSPLRTEVTPVSPRAVMVDLLESDQTNVYKVQNLGEYVNCLSYEEYLSKPLPLSTSSTYMTTSTVKTVKTRWVSDLHTQVGDLLTAIKKQNMKEVNAYSSSLIEISSSYLEESKALFHQGDMAESGALRFKELEPLILRFAQLSKEGHTDSPTMGRLIQTAMLLSHCTEEIKTYLVSFASYWHSFSQQLFCTSTNEEISTNVQIFNRTMQRLAGIVQSTSKHTLSDYDDMDFIKLSEKQECLVKIHVKFSKCQALANQLLTAVLCHKIRPDTLKLGDICIQWSVSVQQLSKCVDDFIGMDSVVLSETTVQKTELKFSDCKSLFILCEASLWLQEASALSVQKFTDEKDQKSVGLLREEVDVLTESVLKVRDELNVSSTASVFLNIDCVLLQKELMLKAKLLMHHIDTLYNRNHTLLQRMVNFALSSTPTDRSVTDETFEADAKSLIDNIIFIKDTLSSTLYLEKKEDVAFLLDHLFFLTGDIITKAKSLKDIHSHREIFLLRSMTLNWLAKADQLISHLQTDDEMEADTLQLIKWCLKLREETEAPVSICDSGLESGTSDIPIQKEQKTANEIQQKYPNYSEQNPINEYSGCTINKTLAYCGYSNNEINGGSTNDLEDRLNHKEQSTSEKKPWIELNNEPEGTVRTSIKRSNSKQEAGTQDEDDKAFLQEPPKTFGEVIQKTTTEKSDENITVHVTKNDHLQITNQRTETEFQVPKEKTYQASVTSPPVQKEITRKESRRIKRQPLSSVTKKATSFSSNIQRTNSRRAGIQRQASKHYRRNQGIDVDCINVKKDETLLETNAGVPKDASNQNLLIQEANTECDGLRPERTNQESKSWKMHGTLSGGQEEKNNQESIHQKVPSESTEYQTNILSQDSLMYRTHTSISGGQKEAVSQDSEIHNTQRGVSKEHKGTTNHEFSCSSRQDVHCKPHRVAACLLSEELESWKVLRAVCYLCQMHRCPWSDLCKIC